MSYNLKRRTSREHKKQVVLEFKKTNNVSEGQLVGMILQKSKALTKPLDVCLQTKYLICLEVSLKQMEKLSKQSENNTEDN